PSPTSGSRTRAHAFTHGTSCPSLLTRLFFLDNAGTDSAVSVMSLMVVASDNPPTSKHSHFSHLRAGPQLQARRCYVTVANAAQQGFHHVSRCPRVVRTAPAESPSSSPYRCLVCRRARVAAHRAGPPESPFSHHFSTDGSRARERGPQPLSR